METDSLPRVATPLGGIESPYSDGGASVIEGSVTELVAIIPLAGRVGHTEGEREKGVLV